MFVHGSLVTLWQFCTPLDQRIFSQISLWLKLAIVALTVLSVIGVLPIIVLAMCPSDVCEPKALLYNIQGLAQRCIVACIVFFLATYSLDFKRAQQVAQRGMNDDARSHLQLQQAQP